MAISVCRTAPEKGNQHLHGCVSRGEDCLPSHADYHPNNLTMARNKTMNCPRCGAWTDIYDSRAPDANVRRRKYVCANMHRFVTISEEVFIGFLDEEEKVREQVAQDQHPGDSG